VESFQDLEELTNFAMSSLDNEVLNFWSTWLEPDGTELIVNIAYPSVSGWQFDCENGENISCLDLNQFDIPAPIIAELEPGFSEQAIAYQVMLSTASSKEWIAGIVSRGYFAQATLHDKSISIHGKPAEELLWRWFEALQ
jgi:hypothetical protein